jgi:hypothetical protein
MPSYEQEEVDGLASVQDVPATTPLISNPKTVAIKISIVVGAVVLATV